ncbi:MliC family protein [Roseovarius sp. M141]|uniref:MliC family protein n=1 Tax=Roseovarius sp. M141 TaxID=2583806 RepID=UPI0020CC0082|nr:MliC family protein [Roseovarius sp. M141]
MTRLGSVRRSTDRSSLTALAGWAFAVAIAISAAPALAGATLSLPLETGPQDEVHSIRYSCADGTELIVQYINTQANALAVMRLAGQDLIFVNVISGSGARYVSGAREWWTKGDEGSLRNEMSGADPVACTDMAGADTKD